MIYVEEAGKRYRIVNTNDPGMHLEAGDRENAERIAERTRESEKLRAAGHSELEILFLTDERFAEWSKADVIAFANGR